MCRNLFILALALGMMVARVQAGDNILLIIADDYGADSSSLYNSTTNGASLPPTPNINALVQKGVLFRNAYANPVCSPTRACLITGRHGFRTGIGDVITGAGSPILTAAELTLPEAFASNSIAGYQLAQFGKWHLANGVNTPTTLGGWPYFAGSLIGEITTYTNWTKTVNGVSTANYTNYATTDIVNDATTWIQARGTNKWFAWVAFNAPHNPLHKPPNELHSYDYLSGTQANINNNPRPYFEAMTEAMDTEIGRLLASVNRTNTDIIFLGDNGTINSLIQPPYPSTRGKGSLYEGGIKVPFIIAGPAVVNPGRTNVSPVHAVDLFSTILELAGISVSSTIPKTITIDSKSLLPILQNKFDTNRVAYEDFFGSDVATNQAGRAIRNSQFKLISFSDGRSELYDLQADPYESSNLLSGTLNATQQANYYSLVMKLGDYQTNLVAPSITAFVRASNQVSVSCLRSNNMTYSLWRATSLDTLTWMPLTNISRVTNGTTITLSDINISNAQQFYRIQATSP